jgi:hypothetical protein
VGNGTIDVGKECPTRKTRKPIVERLFGSSGLPELRTDRSTPAPAARPDICGEMAQQRGDCGNHSGPQELLQLVGCREKTRPERANAPVKPRPEIPADFPDRERGHWMKSPHFSIVDALPHGMIGTEDVEFFGEPSMSLSE